MRALVLAQLVAKLFLEMLRVLFAQLVRTPIIFLTMANAVSTLVQFAITHLLAHSVLVGGR